MLLLSMVSILFEELYESILTSTSAEFRGPGVHHNFDDSDSGYDLDTDPKLKGFGGNQRGRIILLGDGTEVLTDSDDTEMFDHSEEDKDLDSQVGKSLKSDAIPEKLVTTADKDSTSQSTKSAEEKTEK